MALIYCQLGESEKGEGGGVKSGFRDWSLIMGRVLQSGRGGHVKFYPDDNGGGGGGVLAML